MFDVLVYLYENYWRPDACPDHEQLTRKLSAVGFETDEIQEALRWLDGLAEHAEAYVGRQGRQPARLHRPPRSSAGRRLDRLHQLPGIRRRAAAADARDGHRPRHRVGGGPMDLEDLKIIVLMVFWSLGEEPDALILDELFVAPEERLIH
jgi:Smg protein